MRCTTMVGVLRCNHERFTVPIVMHFDWTSCFLFPNRTAAELPIADWLVELASAAVLFVTLWYRLNASATNGLESLSNVGWFD